MANLSEQKREKMLQILDALKAQHKDEETIIALNEIKNEINSKKYGLVWEQHEENVDIQMKTHVPVFTEVKDREINSNPSDEKFNFILEGDNLHSLKLLNKTHRGKIDVIYIDPPYNTMNEGFVYSDKKIDSNDGFRHSKWLSFMNERLRVANNLLAMNGLIFISVDENEYAQLKLLCDEIFNENNFVENIIWNKRVPKNDKGIGNIHEYILVYAKSSDFKYKLMVQKDGMDEINNLISEARKNKKSIPETEEELRKLYKIKEYPRAITLYNNIDNNYRIYGKINMSWPNGNTFGPRYDVLHPITKKPVKVPDRGWRWSEKTLQEKVDYNNIQQLHDGSYMCGNIWFSSKDSMQPSSVNYLDEVDRMLLRSIISLKSDGGMILEEIFGEKSKFAYPKPVELIKMLIDACTYNEKNAIILDFFAGSGTTAQAVMELNNEDGGSREFIICTNNESGICEQVTYPRIKTVITGKREDDSSYSEGIPSNVKYFRTDFVSKESEDEFYSVEEQLSNHIKEMIELENGISIDNEKYIMILTDEEADVLEKTPERIKKCERIYVSGEVLLTQKQENLLKDKDIITIPQYYFEDELMEVGEL